MEDNFFTFNQEDLVSDGLHSVFISSSTRETLEQIADDRRLLDEERQVLFETVKDIFRGKLEDDDIVGTLFDRTEIELERGLAVQSDVYGRLLSDIEDELDDQRQVYIDFNPEEFLPPDPRLKDLDEELAIEAVEKSGMAPADESSKTRLIKIVTSHFKDIRDDDETKAVLQKPSKTGGVEFSNEQASALLLFVNEVAAKKEEKLKELEEEKKEWQEKVAKAKQAKEERLKRMEQSSSPEPPAEPTETAPDDIMLADEDEDEKEIEEIKEKAVAPVESATLPADFLAKQVNQAVSDSKLELRDENMKVRYRTLVDAFFRDLRDDFETKEKLFQSVEGGGMGLNPDEANRAMGILEAKIVTYQAAITERVAQEKIDFVAKRQEKIMNEEAVRERTEAEQRNELFQRVTGKRPSSVPSMSAGGANQTATPGYLPSPKPIQPIKPTMIPVVGALTKKEAEVAKGEPPLNLPSIDKAKSGPMMLQTPDDCDLDKHKKKKLEETPTIKKEKSLKTMLGAEGKYLTFHYSD